MSDISHDSLPLWLQEIISGVEKRNLSDGSCHFTVTHPGGEAGEEFTRLEKSASAGVPLKTI